jgi:hypothetical protein
VERTQQNLYGLVVSSVEQNEILTGSLPNPQSKTKDLAHSDGGLTENYSDRPKYAVKLG